MSESEATERFEHAGLECKVLRVRDRHDSGYVKTPEGIGPVRWTSDYDSKHGEILDAEVDVWGGVTYGPDDEGWVGFDNAHSRLIQDHREEDTEREAVRAETKRLAEKIRDLASSNDSTEEIP